MMYIMLIGIYLCFIETSALEYPNISANGIKIISCFRWLEERFNSWAGWWRTCNVPLSVLQTGDDNKLLYLICNTFRRLTSIVLQRFTVTYCKMTCNGLFCLALSCARLVVTYTVLLLEMTWIYLRWLPLPIQLLVTCKNFLRRLLTTGKLILGDLSVVTMTDRLQSRLMTFSD